MGNIDKRGALKSQTKVIRMGKVREFEDGWRRMIEDLRNPQIFFTTGGKKRFEAWSENDHISYKKSTSDICPLSKSDFKKGYEIYMMTNSLKTPLYSRTLHGSYIPPLLEKYFIIQD